MPGLTENLSRSDTSTKRTAVRPLDARNGKLEVVQAELALDEVQDAADVLDHFVIEFLLIRGAHLQPNGDRRATIGSYSRVRPPSPGPPPRRSAARNAGTVG